MSHTLGPWRADKTRSLVIRSNHQNKLIAMIGYKYDKEDEANAHIIAAAPEMYDAIKRLLDRYTTLANSGDAGFWDPEEENEVKLARGAISRAEGKP